MQEHLDTAMRLADRLPEKERLALLGWKATGEKRTDEAQRLRDEAAEAYPAGQGGRVLGRRRPLPRRRYDAAMPYFERAPKLDPNYVLALDHAGPLAYEALGTPRGAARARARWIGASHESGRATATRGGRCSRSTGATRPSRRSRRRSRSRSPKLGLCPGARPYLAHVPRAPRGRPRRIAREGDGGAPRRASGSASAKRPARLEEPLLRARGAVPGGCSSRRSPSRGACARRARWLLRRGRRGPCATWRACLRGACQPSPPDSRAACGHSRRSRAAIVGGGRGRSAEGRPDRCSAPRCPWRSAGDPVAAEAMAERARAAPDWADVDAVPATALRRRGRLADGRPRRGGGGSCAPSPIGPSVGRRYMALRACSGRSRSRGDRDADGRRRARGGPVDALVADVRRCPAPGRPGQPLPARRAPTSGPGSGRRRCDRVDELLKLWQRADADLPHLAEAKAMKKRLAPKTALSR